jgi:hypothetical protein
MQSCNEQQRVLCGRVCYDDPIGAADEAARQHAASDLVVPMPLVVWCDQCESFHVVRAGLHFPARIVKTRT